MIGLPADYYPIEIAIESRAQGVIEGFSNALAHMDVRVDVDFELQQCLLSVRNEADLVQAKTVLSGLSSDLNFGQPQVAYREKIGRAAEIDFTHKKQSGGTGQFARIKLQFEPLEAGSGFVFESAIVGGAVPKEYIPGVQKGLEMAKENGLLAGYPVTDFRARLVDGAFHDVASSVLAFELAARGAFRELKGKGDPRLMEPMVALTISAPPGQAGAIRNLMEQLGATEIVRLQDQEPAHLEFNARLVAVFRVRQILMDHVADAQLVATRFTGMRDVARPFPDDGGDDCPPAAVRLRA